MNTLLLLAQLSLFSLVPGPLPAAADDQPDYQREIEESRALRAGQAVELHHAMGELEVTAGDGDQVQLQASVEVKGERAKEFGEQVKVEITSDGNALVIRTRYPEGPWKDLSFGVKMRLSLPRRHDLDAEVAFGSARITGLEGKTKVQVSNGSLTAQDIRGSLTLASAFGSVAVRGCRGPVSLKGNCGKIEVSDVAGGDLDLESAFGEVLVDKVGGAARITCTNGPLSVRDVSGKATVKAQFGRVSVGKIGGGVDLQSSNGLVEVSDVEGDVAIEHSFGAVVLGEVRGNLRVGASNGSVTARGISASRSRPGESRIDIETSFGSIELALPDPPSVRLDAAATFGGIQSDFELSGVERQSAGTKCRCMLGEGATQLLLRSSNGSIRLVSELGGVRKRARERVVDARG